MSKTDLVNALYGNDVATVENLYPACFYSINEIQCTAMHVVAVTENTDVLAALYRLDPLLLDRQNALGETPMHFAAKYDNQLMVDALHMIGSRAHNIKDKHRRTPYDVAATFQLRQHILNLYVERTLTRDLVAVFDEE